MSNSKLVNYKKITHNKTKMNNKVNKKITIHHMAGNLSVETCAKVFSGTRKASSNYGIGTDGRVGLYVDECDRAWTSSSSENDSQAVTIEVANDVIGGDWHVSDKALAKLIDLCVDICQRNNIKELKFTGDKNGNLTLHYMFAATACPGPYLKSKIPYIVQQVNSRLVEKETPKTTSTKTLYKVQTGAFSKKANATTLLNKLKKFGYTGSVVQASGLYKVQVGAYSVKSNADAMVTRLKKSGFDAIIVSSGSTSTTTTTPKKSVTEVAKEVIKGLWGTGTDRKKNLEKAGYNYNEVQKKVNELMKK